MAKKISEPQVEYQKIKKQVLYARAAKDKIKISSLRGKMMKQSDEDIKHQISELRKE